MHVRVSIAHQHQQQNTVVERAKSAEEAVAHLEQVASHIPDKLTFKERKGATALLPPPKPG